MNSYSSDQMLLPSITHLLDSDINMIKGVPAYLPIHQSLLSDDVTMGDTNSSLHPDNVKPAPKMLTPPDSPVFSELTTPSYLMRMTSHDGSQMVPNLDSVCEALGNGFNSAFLTLENLDSLNHVSELEHLHARDIMSTTPTKSEMFDDTDSGSEWPGIYIDDNDDTSVPSPTPSPPFDAPCSYESPDLTAIESLLLYHEQPRIDRRKNNSISTEESLQSDSGSEMGSCPSPTAVVRPTFHIHHGSKTKSKNGGRMHNYQRRTITKSLNELREAGTKPVGSLSTSSSLSSSLSSSSNTERRKRGRPRKRSSGEMGEREDGGRRKGSRKAVKGSHLWEFILNTLKNEEYCPQYIRWEDKNRGVFRIVNSKVVATMWGQIKNNPRMTYEKLSRAMRYYYKRQILERVDKARLVYKFGEKAEGWQKEVKGE